MLFGFMVNIRYQQACSLFAPKAHLFQEIVFPARSFSSLLFCSIGAQNLAFYSAGTFVLQSILCVQRHAPSTNWRLCERGWAHACTAIRLNACASSSISMRIHWCIFPAFAYCGSYTPVPYIFDVYCVILLAKCTVCIQCSLHRKSS